MIYYIKIKLFKYLWGLGIGDWGLGIGDWGLGPIPNPHPQSPIPNPQNILILFKIRLKFFYINKLNIYFSEYIN